LRDPSTKQLQPIRCQIPTLPITNLENFGFVAKANGFMVARVSPVHVMLKCFRPAGVLILILISVGGQAEAFTVNLTPLSSTEKNIETLGTGVAIALPIAAAGIAWYKNDRIVLAQLAVEGLLTVGTAYALKNIVREERPDGSDYQSFPSETTAVAASGSSFLWGRYGWEYGLPASALTEFVAYSRVQARQHRWYDTLASSAIAAGYGYVLTTPFKKRYNLDTSLSATPDGAFVHLSYAW
jgi:membrane-associated phospholipid phosphatase